MRRIPLILLIALVASCRGGGTETETTQPLVGPATVAASWLEAVSVGDVAALETLVEPTGLAVVASVENNLRSDELVGLLNSGLDGDLAIEYWAEFAEDFEAIRGESLADVVVGDTDQVPGISNYSVVSISTPATEGRVVLRHTETGWQIDFAATVGPALVGPLGEYLQSAIGGVNGAEIADAYAVAVVPGLEAAFALDPSNTNLQFETEFIRQLVSD